MRSIAIISPSLSGGGGAERTTALLANALCDRYLVYLYVLSTGDSVYELDKRVKFIKVDEHIKNNTNQVLRNVSRFEYLKGELKNINIDLIIGYTIMGGIFACLVRLFTKSKCVVCERQDPYQFGKTSRLFRDYIYRFTTGAVFQTLDAQNYFRNIIKDSVVIPNFIDDTSLPEPLLWKVRDNMIITAGRLSDAKNQASIIRAFALVHKLFPEYKLKIYGDGPLRTKLENLVNELELNDCVMLPGRTKGIFDQYNKSKVFVLSSLYEGYPNALLEAMAMGCACISTDCPCGGPKSMIENGKNGLLVNVADDKDLSEKMISLLESEEFMMKIANNALERRGTNSQGKIIQLWVDYMERIINL
jgi:GalNAc-alpha-(1->4)-GalNAc-alpha-(1->3)-diNAcBac-PP-undecaprenol alpha-1,4-N-acetyl-D-galactosaminyltransferase